MHNNPRISNSHHQRTLNLGNSNRRNFGMMEAAENDDVVNMNPFGDRDNSHPKRKKTYRRHNNNQIRELESFYKDCHHPDERQKKQLAVLLGLEPLQVKFWFQNRRNQDKAHRERLQCSLLKTEQEKLVAENERYKEALSNPSCTICRGSTSSSSSSIIGELSSLQQHLMNENQRLRKEIEKISEGVSLISNNYGRSSLSSQPNLSHQSPVLLPSSTLEVEGSSNYGSQATLTGGQMYLSSSGSVEPSLPVSDKPKIVELAVCAIEELERLAIGGVPLWIPNGNSEILNEQEYINTFPRGLGPKPLGFRTEASKDSMIVSMNPINLIEILMDVNQWSSMFSDIVSSAMTLEVLSIGVAEKYNGALQVMSAEFQIPTPLVPTRDNYFVRYSSKQQHDGIWAVVDVSIDHLRPSATLRSRRRASGCLIQDLSCGYSKVTWLEHVEVLDDDSTDVAMHNHNPNPNHCLAFGAKRWLSTLDRQCQRRNSMTTPIRDINSVLTVSDEARKSILKVTQRMMKRFCIGAGASKAQYSWRLIDPSEAEGEDNSFQVLIRKTTTEEPDRPVICAATSLWLPATPNTLFQFLRNNNQRSQWDTLSGGCVLKEIAHIANGGNPGNCVSLLCVDNPTSNSNVVDENMLILQESCVDSTGGSYVVYAPIGVSATQAILNGGGDPESSLVLVPSGFAILPGDVIGSGTGCLLTVAFQIVVNAPLQSMNAAASTTLKDVATFVKTTVGRIKTALL